MSLAIALTWVLAWPSLASASIIVSNAMEAGVPSSSEGPRHFSYLDATETAFDTEVDFDTGVYVDTEVDPTGEFLQLAQSGAADWWDLDWEARRCFTVDNPGVALDEHQVRLVFDSTTDQVDGYLQPNGEDYRAIAADDTTELDLWVESGVGTADTIVWVQLDLVGFGSTDFCLYFGNPTAPSVSSKADVFSYSVARPLYYPLSGRYTGGGGASGSVDVVSYVDGNQVTIEGVTQTINAGQVVRFTGVTSSSAILATGPIGGRGIANGMDSVAPISFAGTDFVFPSNRGTQQWAMVAPSGMNATVQIFTGATLAWSGNVAGTVVVETADVGNNDSAFIRSTNGVPILVNHTTTQNNDAVVLPPFLGDDLLGVRSRQMLVAGDGTANFSIYRSDGTFLPVFGLAAGSEYTENVGSDLDGDGTAIRITDMNVPTGAIQQADRDGNESTSFLPERLLENEYYLPTSADYIAFACPEATTVNVGGLSLPCAPFFPGSVGHAVSGPAAAGTRIFSSNGANFFAYYEDSGNDDETNLLGMKVASAYDAVDLIVTGGVRELRPATSLTGTWTSPAIDTSTAGSNVFGLLTLAAEAPVGSQIEFRVSRGATAALALSGPFLGPDGTSATSFDIGESLAPYAWDFGDHWVVLQLTLTTIDPAVTPTVDRVAITHDLVAQGRVSNHAVVTAGPDTSRTYLLRTWTEDPLLTAGTATVTHVASSGLGPSSAMVLTADETPQVVIAGGAVTQSVGIPVNIGPGLPHSVAVDTQNMAGAQVSAVWQGTPPGTGILIQHRLEITFS